MTPDFGTSLCRCVYTHFGRLVKAWGMQIAFVVQELGIV